MGNSPLVAGDTIISLERNLKWLVGPISEGRRPFSEHAHPAGNAARARRAGKTRSAGADCAPVCPRGKPFEVLAPGWAPGGEAISIFAPDPGGRTAIRNGQAGSAVPARSVGRSGVRQSREGRPRQSGAGPTLSLPLWEAPCVRRVPHKAPRGQASAGKYLLRVYRGHPCRTAPSYR